MVRCSKLMICYVSILIMTGCGLGSVKNLHILDRIPHEKQKGYVTFSGTWKSESAMLYGMLKYKISKKEFGHKVPIMTINIGSEITIPITDVPGEHIYIIEYPSIVAYPKDGKPKTETLTKLFGDKLVLNVLHFSDRPIAWFSKMDTKEIKLQIKNGQTTHIKLHLDFKLYEESSPEAGPFISTFSSDAEGPVLEAMTGFEILKNACGPRTYKSDYKNVFNNALKAIEKLHWTVVSSEKNNGKISIEIKRFPGNNYFFTIGVNQLEENKIRVDISSDASWQRWGSINTNMSLEKIKLFYNTLDAMI